MTAPREYDVVLYGAGGFTGRQTVAYFAKHAPAGLRWAIAGRHREKLEAARAEAGGPAPATAVLVADSRDQASVDAVVSRTRIVLSTAGPFALYGTPVVDACVRLGTHYVDITGETPWMREIAARYHEPAAASGTRIIPCCGFDSVPSDLGTFLLARHIQHTFGVACTEVRSYFQLSAGLNGGTVASLLNMLESRRTNSRLDRPDPPDQPDRPAAALVREVRSPRYDAQQGVWIGPFVMAPTNSWVVRRSATLLAEWEQPYAPEFAYQEAMKYDPPLARARATAAAAGLGLLFTLLKQPVTRPLMARLLPKPGAGPSVETMDNGWFTCELLGLTADGRQTRGLVRYDGDPGNRATTVLVCEAALALALDSGALPGGPARGGVLTPATGLGEVYAERLRRAGVTLQIPVS